MNILCWLLPLLVGQELCLWQQPTNDGNNQPKISYCVYKTNGNIAINIIMKYERDNVWVGGHCHNISVRRAVLNTKTKSQGHLCSIYTFLWTAILWRNGARIPLIDTCYR